MNLRRLVLYASTAMLLSLSGCEDLFSDGIKTDSITHSEVDYSDSSISGFNQDIVSASASDSSFSKINLPISCQNGDMVTAFTNHESDVQVRGCGVVSAILPDDNEGSRHQRFIVRLQDVEPAQTILIAHNIDLAPRVSDLKIGSHVSFYGEYEYNPKGGVVHWTHKDPKSIHAHGWVEFEGQRFE